MNFDDQKKAIDEILLERHRQEHKFGEQNHDPFVYLTILIEEVGELAECILHKLFGGPKADNLRNEAIQVAAVGLAIVELIDRDVWQWGSHNTPRQK